MRFDPPPLFVAQPKKIRVIEVAIPQLQQRAHFRGEARDHGALLQIFAGRRNALQYEIGNPQPATSSALLSMRRFG